LERLNILIVDDDNEVSEFIAQRINRESKQFKISSVESGEDCLEFIKSHHVDCIISDYQMPGIDGMALLKTLRSQGETVPFIFITGQGNEDLAREAFKNGAYDYFTKESGFAHFPRIANSIEQAVRHHKSEKDNLRAKESLQLYKSLLDRSGEAIVVSDPLTGQLFFANDKHCSNLGYDRDKLMNMTVMDIEKRFPDKAAWDAHVEEIKSKGYVVQEGVNRRSDGSQFPVEANTTHTTVGNRDYLMSLIRDITERKQSEETLREAELRYHAVFDQSPDGILIVDREGRFIEFNEAAHSQLGYTREEFSKLRIADIDPFDGPEEIKFKMDEILKKGGAEYDVKHVARGGEVRDVHIINQVMVLSGETYIHTIWRDITERKKAEDSLLEEKSKLDSVLGNIGDVISIHDIGFRVLYQNTTSNEFLGEHTGKICYKAYHGRDEICEECPVALCFEDGNVHTTQKTKDTDRGLRYMEVKASPVRDSSGRIIAAVEAARDITERKQAEGDLEKGLRQQKAILDNIPHMAWLKDNDGRFIAVNESLANAFGLMPEEIAGKSEYDFFDKEVADRCLETDAETVRSGNRSMFEEPIISHDGETVVLEVIKTPVLSDDGDVIGMVGIARDVSESRELERRKADFYAMLSHDLKSPISSIIGFAEILKDNAGGLDKDSLDSVSSIYNSGVKLMNLVEDFLAVSRIESGNLSLNAFPLDMSLLIRDTLDEFTAVARNKGVDISLEVEDNMKGVADKKLVTRAVSNLINNAVKYTRPEGRIKVKGSKANGAGGDRVLISVSDTGPGIPPEEQLKVFNKYYRLTKDTKLKGSGLGLYIVKVIAEAHGGSVVLESEVGKGSNFILTLPAR